MTSATQISRGDAREFAQKASALGHIVANEGNVFDEAAVAFLRARGVIVEPGVNVLYEDEVLACHEELAELEEQAADWLAGDLSDFRIITPDESGPSNNPKDPDYNRLDAVVRVDVADVSKVIEWPDGTLERLTFKVYTAIGVDFDHYRFTSTVGGETVHRYVGVEPGAVNAGPRDGEQQTAFTPSDHHEVRSAPEGFYRDGEGVVHQYGGASALAKRLLEAYCAGAV